MDVIKKWYDGYHFGDFDVYCPWDVMNYLRDYQHDPRVKPSSYWKNTSDNAIIRSFIDYAGSSITENWRFYSPAATLLRKTISYHDYKEDFYHAFLAGIFAGAGYRVKSNRESGEGRSDVVVFDAAEGRVAVFEAKYSEKLQDLEVDCDKALKQIDTKMYAQEYEDDYDQIICYGIAFYKKRCLVRKRQ